LLQSLESIKIYSPSNYFPKAIKKLTKSPSDINQQAAVAEIIVVGYYCRKFLKKKQIRVEWERVITNSGRSIDISLMRDGKQPINIEITTKNKNEAIRNFFDLRYKVKVAIEKRSQKISKQKFCYLFSLNTNDKDSNFLENDIEQFIQFIFSVRQNGEGKYYFPSKREQRASVEIKKLNRLRREYASSIDIWAGMVEDDRALRNKILEKIEGQLPNGEINFIHVLNLANLDDIDFREAFLGKEIWRLDRERGMRLIGRKQNGVITAIRQKKHALVYGLIYSGWDYSKKVLISNPLVNLPNSILNIVQ